MSLVIFKTKNEIQSKLDRQGQAENLILQLPEEHDGRNTWLLNYGIGSEAEKRRVDRGLEFSNHYQAVDGFKKD